jgi:hypothetical protein
LRTQNRASAYALIVRLLLAAVVQRGFSARRETRNRRARSCGGRAPRPAPNSRVQALFELVCTAEIAPSQASNVTPLVDSGAPRDWQASVAVLALEELTAIVSGMSPEA